MAKDRVTIALQGGTVKVQLPAGMTKSDMARELFRHPQGFSVKEVSEAVGMHYSQAHSVRAKMPQFVQAVQHGKSKDARVDFIVPEAPKKTPRGQYHKGPKRGQRLTEEQAATWEPVAEQRDTRRAPKMVKGKLRDGRLRTGKFPKDVEVGKCANCGYDLAIRPTGPGLVFVHINATPEEYLAKIQFCQAVPEVLL